MNGNKMKPKTVFVILGLALTINLIQGYPRYQRYKPVVNRNPEKPITTEKPIEERRNSLFPKNTKKYMVTDRPSPRINAPSSYKYVLVKRPLMLNFDLNDKPVSRYNTTVAHQPLMKKLNLVVSTPSPSELDRKKNHWKNGHPIHIQGNNTIGENQDKKTSQVTPNINSDKDTVTPQPYINVTTENPSNKAPEEKTSDIIILPVNEEERKSNLNEIEDEVKDIIALVNKMQKLKENSTTVTPSEKEIAITPTVALTTEVIKSSSTQTSTDYTTIKNEEIREQEPLDYDYDTDWNALPENYLNKPNSSSAINNKTTSSLVEKNNETEATESRKPDIVFIPVNLSELKSNPNLIADEIQNMIDNMNQNVTPKMEDKTTTLTTHTVTSTTTPQTTFTTASTTSSTSNTKMMTTQIETESTTEPAKHINSTEKEPFNDDNSYNSYNEIGDVIYYISQNELNPSTLNELSPATTAKVVGSTAEDQTTTDSSTEIVFIPINLDKFNSYPNLIADEVNNITKDGNKNVTSTIESPVSTTKMISTTTTIRTPTTTADPVQTILMEEVLPESETSIATTPSPSTAVNEITSTLKSNTTTENSSLNMIYLPVNLGDLKSHPEILEDEIQQVLEQLRQAYDNKTENDDKENLPWNPDTETTTIFEETTIKNSTLEILSDVTTKSTTKAYEIPTSEKPLQNIVSTESVTEVTTKPFKEPKIIYIPVNVEDFKANPNGLINEVQYAVDKMNKDNNLTETDGITTEKPFIKQGDNTTKDASLNMTTKYLPTETEMITTTETIVHTTTAPTSKTVENLPTTENTTAEHELFFIPVNFNDLQSNPEIADEVKDIVNYMNKMHPQNETTTAKNELPVTEVTERLISTQTPKTVATKNYFTTSLPLETASFTETESTTLSSVEPSNDNLRNSTPAKKDQALSETSQGIVFIPISLEELKSNPDLVVNEVNDVVNRMKNEQRDSNNSTTEKYSTESTSAKTTTPCNKLSCSVNNTKPIKESTENVTPKYILIKPMQVTPLKDDDDDDIFVGKPYQRKQEAGDGAQPQSTVNDDISDVIYVIKKNKKT